MSQDEGERVIHNSASRTRCSRRPCARAIAPQAWSLLADLPCLDFLRPKVYCSDVCSRGDAILWKACIDTV